MRKVQFLAVFWTMFLAIPLTVLGISIAAYLTDHLSEIFAAVANWSLATSAVGRGWSSEISQRWPEIAGMIVGQIVILTILIFVRQNRIAEEENKA